MVCYRKRYIDPVNQAVVKKVLAETRSLDPTVCAMNVQGMVAQRYKERHTLTDVVMLVFQMQPADFFRLN